MKTEQREVFLKEAGQLLIDIAKLVFGGVIITGLIKLDINWEPLLISGCTVTLLTASMGIAFIVSSKAKRKKK